MFNLLATAGGNAAFGHRQGHLWMIFLRHETGDFGKRCPSMLKKVKLVLKVTTDQIAKACQRDWDQGSRSWKNLSDMFCCNKMAPQHPK